MLTNRHKLDGLAINLKSGFICLNMVKIFPHITRVKNYTIPLLDKGKYCAALYVDLTKVLKSVNSHFMSVEILGLINGSRTALGSLR